MTIVNGTVLRTVAQFKVADEATRVQNVYSWKITDLVSAVAADVHSDLVAQIIAMMTAIDVLFDVNFTLETCRTTDLTAREFVGDGVGAGFTGAGGAVNTAPAQVAALVLGRNLKLGFTSRKYIGPVVAAAFSDGVLAGGAGVLMNNYKDAYEAIFAGAVTTNTYQPGVPVIVAGFAVAFNAILAGRGTVVQTARTMRTRIPARGLS